MRLNQVTASLPDLDAGWRFYTGLGLIPVVDARPSYLKSDPTAGKKRIEALPSPGLAHSA